MPDAEERQDPALEKGCQLTCCSCGWAGVSFWQRLCNLMSRGKGQKNAIISQGVLRVCFAPHSQCCLQSASEGTLCQQLPLFPLYPLDGVGDVGSGKEGRLGPDGASKAGGESTVSEAGGQTRCCLFLATSWLAMEGALQLVLHGRLSLLMCPYLLFVWLLCVWFAADTRTSCLTKPSLRSGGR